MCSAATILRSSNLSSNDTVAFLDSSRSVHFVWLAWMPENSFSKWSRRITVALSLAYWERSRIRHNELHIIPVQIRFNATAFASSYVILWATNWEDRARFSWFSREFHREVFFTTRMLIRSNGADLRKSAPLLMAETCLFSNASSRSHHWGTDASRKRYWKLRLRSPWKNLTLLWFPL